MIFLKYFSGSLVHYTASLLHYTASLVHKMDNNNNFNLNKSLYDKEIIFLTASKFIDNFFIEIQPHGENELQISYRSKNENLENETQFKDNFCNILIQEQVISDLQKKFGHLRDIIVKEAFQPVENK
ncbi:MAG: hypothetical protein LBF22_06540 [Deltaproteobacteria bacterium]|jgi:His-Xaa-Ser system protein HxsD|nr:hypothetical protein [Deltaproteobacteria bacterium]